MQSAISTSDLTKVYALAHRGRKTAVQSLDLEVRPGELFGFLGPNGAGKTTTIKMLLGFIHPTAGTAQLMGVPVDHHEARARVGYLPEQPYFHKFMTPREIVTMHAGLVGLPRRTRRRHAMEAIERVGLRDLSLTPASKLSKGQVQRIGIAQALVGDPTLLILDEPASGLDPLGRRQVRDLLLELRSQGKTVFLSSHLLSEIETVCDRVGVLVRGRLVAVGTPDEIKQADGWTAVTTAGTISSQVGPRLQSLGAMIRQSEGEAVIAVGSERVYEIIDVLRESGLPLISVTPVRETLEEAFLRLAA